MTDTTDREQIAQCMLGLGLATGHGDTVEDLLSELTAQVKEMQTEHARMRERMHHSCMSGQRITYFDIHPEDKT